MADILPAPTARRWPKIDAIDRACPASRLIYRRSAFSSTESLAFGDTVTRDLEGQILSLNAPATIWKP